LNFAPFFKTIYLSRNSKSKISKYTSHLTNTNKIAKARLIKCPGALINVKMRGERDEFLKEF